MKATKNTPSTQKFIEIDQIKEDTLILKDGSLRAVVMVSSMNFALKSAEEQVGIIQGYMQFLNSLDFPLQITIQSRKLDIDNYLATLEDLEKKQNNELLRLQMNDYRQFVKELIDLADIMAKKFYVTISYYPSSDKQKGFFPRVKELFSAAAMIKLTNEQFLKRKHVLDQRVQNVIGGLASLGLSAVQLDTQSMIELFYNVYNPDVSRVEKVTDIDKLQVEINS